MCEVANTCPGSSNAPSAPPGYLCIYPEVGGLFGATAVEGKANSALGFTIQWTTTGTPTLDQTGVAATWAYTAP